MVYYFLKRILLLIPVLLGVSCITFLLLQMLPGGFIEMQMYRTENESFESSVNINNTISDKTLNELKAHYGYDKPVFTRYLIWLKGMFTADFGNSSFYSEPVTDVILSRLPITLLIGSIGFILLYSVSVPLGILKALKNKSKFDILTSFFVLAGYSIPGWAFGTLTLILLGGGSFLNVFPLGGYLSEGFSQMNYFEKIFDLLRHITLPVLSYVITGFASLTLLTKNSILENISKEYIRFAYAKGMNEKKIIRKYLLRNSLINIITGAGHFFGIIFSGSLLIEKVFNIPGMGLLAFNAVLNRDYTLSMGIIVISSFLLILGNIISDFLYTLADPRINFEKR